MKKRKANSLRTTLTGVALVTLAIFLTVNVFVLLEEHDTFSDELDSSFGEELVNQTARNYQAQLSRIEQILERLCANPELSKYMSRGMEIQRNQWARDTMLHYGVDASKCDSITIVSRYQSASYGEGVGTASFDALWETAVVKRALRENRCIILTTNTGEEKEEIDTVLGKEASKYYMMRCIYTTDAGPVIVLARLNDDFFTTMLSPYLVITDGNYVEYVEYKDHKKTELVRGLTIGEDALRDCISAQFADGAFRVCYIQGLFEESGFNIHLMPMLTGGVIFVIGATVFLIHLSGRNLTETLQHLKKAVDQYEDIKSKEHRAWFALRRRKRTLRESIVRIILVSLLPPVLLFNVAMNLWFNHEADGLEKRYRSQQCLEVYDNISNLLDGRLSMMLGIAYDVRMQSALREENFSQVETVIRDYGYLYMFNDDIYLYNADYELLSSTDITQKTVLSATELTNIKEKLNDEQWFWEENMIDTSGSLRIVHWIKDTYTGKIIGVLQCEMSILELKNCWVDSSINHVIIQDSNGSVAYTSEITKGDAKGQIKHLVENSWKQPYSNNRFKVIVGTTENNSALFLADITSLQLLMFLLLVLVTLVGAMVISNTLLDQFFRIETATSNMYKGFRPGENTLKHFPENLAIAEFSDLGESFNQMADRIEELMDQIIVSTNRDATLRAEKKEADAQAMQLQINPHFMYNTLESISCVISMGRKDDAEEMVTILGEMFRYSVDPKRRVVTLEEDLAVLEKYIKLMNIRLDGKVHYTCNVDERHRKLPIIKLLLQPIFENAFLHGGNYNECCISLTSWQDEGNLILCVEDNGHGIMQEQLAEINDDLSRGVNGSRIGLGNVNNRIKLVYGNEFGVSVESKPDHYTKVFLKLPLSHPDNLIL